MKNLATLCLLTILISIACSEGITEVLIHDDTGNVVEKYHITLSDSVRQGATLEYYDTGETYAKSSYETGKIHGLRTIYYKNGQVQIEENYINGEFQGEYNAYYKNGQLDLTGMYENGTMEGKWKRHYKSGAVMEIVEFVNNEENGPFIEYHENGNLKAEGVYVYANDEAREHGLLKMYNEKGEIIKKMDCKKGHCRTIWTLEDGEITIEENDQTDE